MECRTNLKVRITNKTARRRSTMVRWTTREKRIRRRRRIAQEKNLRKRLLYVLKEVRDNDAFADCVVITKDGQSFRSHRLLLAACGDYFKTALSTQLKTSCSSGGEVKIPLPFEAPIVESVLDFAYTGRALLSEENVPKILPAADYLGITELTDSCCTFLKSKVTSVNAIGIYKFAMAYFCSKLALEVNHYILVNFMEIANEEEYLTLTFDDLLELFLNDKLNVHGEEKVIDALDLWVRHDLNEREKDINPLLKTVRWAYVPERYFKNKLQNLTYKDKISADILEEAERAIRDRQGSRYGPKLYTLPVTYPYRPRIPNTVVFAYGGWRSVSFCESFETYDIRVDKWQVWKSNQTPRAYHGMTCVDNIIYVAGGYDGQRYFDSLVTYNPVTGVWRTRSSMNLQRCYVTLVELDGKLYAIGGYNGNTREKSVEVYTIAKDTWKFSARMNHTRSDAGAVACNNKIYVAGGFNGYDVLNSVEMYDPLTDTWTVISSMTIPRSGVSLCCYRGYIYAIGGYNGVLRLKSCERLCPHGLGRTWRSDIPDMLSPRSNFSCVVIEDKILVVGGFDGKETLYNTECYNGSYWEQCASLKKNRSALALCICKDLPNCHEFSLLSQLGLQKSNV